MADTGRPSIKVESVVQKLEQALQNGFSIDRACYLSGVARSTYYHWADTDKRFLDRMERAREWATEQARQNIVLAIKAGDANTSKWWLERKVKDEFSLRNELTGKDGEDLLKGMTDEQIARILAVGGGVATETTSEHPPSPDQKSSE